MKIQMIGIDHNTAGIDIRTVFSFTKIRMAEALELICQEKGIAGCVILSTCNRMELWISAEDTFDTPLFDLICRVKGVSQKELEPYFHFREGQMAVDHLFRLAGGLESRILGEDQILSQVKHALSFAREHYATDHVLETLFRMAVTAGKKVKTQVVLSRDNHSVVDQALATLKKSGFTFAGKTCMVIGNGEMGKLTVLALQKEQADVTVTVRQYHKGVVDIPPGCKRMDYGNRMEYMGDCDYVFSATASPNVTVTQEDVSKLNRKGKLVFVDLAVPRDIEITVGDLPDVCLYDLDDFKIDIRDEAVQEHIREAEAILEEHIREFYVWYDGQDLIPLIQSIKQSVGKDVVWRMQKGLRKMELSSEGKMQLEHEVEQAVQRSINKMMFDLRNSVDGNTYYSCIRSMEHNLL